MKRRLRYAPPKGPVAISPKAWGEEFDVVLFGGKDPEPLFTTAGPYAVVQISGPLAQRSGWMSDSYDDIRARTEAAMGSECEAVCLRIDSPGGDWCGALELSRELRDMAEKGGKRLVAFTDGQALSAGYALACAASEIVATESATVGSVGVWAPLVDATAQDAMMGVKIAVAASGQAKADRNPHVGMTDEAFARLQAQVNEQAEIFFEHVSEARGMPVSKVRALEGAELFGQRGVAAGLTDRLVNSWSEFLTSEKGNPMPSKASKFDEAYGLLKQAAEGDDEEAKKRAKKCLKALEEGEEEKKDEKEAKAKASDEEEKKAKAAKEDEPKAKASDEDEKKKKDAEAKAKASAPSAFDLAARVHALEADKAAKADAEARATLLAKRPDFSPEIRATLAKASIDQLEEAVKTWPKIGSKLGQAAAASQAIGTRDARELEGAGSSGLSPTEEDYIARRMGAVVDGGGIKRVGHSLELGVMTPAQARAYLASDAGKRAQALVQTGKE